MMPYVRRREPDPEIGEGEEYEMRSAGDPVYNVNDAKERGIVAWRVDCFERLGFRGTAALALAMRRDVDRERVEKLATQGATLQQIVAIFL